MRRRIARAAKTSFPALAAVALVAPAVPAALAQDQAAPAAAPHVVSADESIPPRRKVVKHDFRPWSRPNPRQVREIIRSEGRRWRVSPQRLSRRVACESRFRWWAGNGPYRGLLQFHSSTFQRGMRTIRDRRVRLVRRSTRSVRGVRVVRWSDGRVERERGRRVRQRVLHVYRGRLPSRPELTHGWAQLRIGAQAIRGRSAVSSGEWSCPA